MKNVIIIAAPAGGKGTISDMLKNKYGYEHISTGDLLREEANNNLDIAKAITDGKLVTDDVVFGLLSNKLKTIQGKQFILDGWPRNIEQNEMTIKLFQDLGINNYIVIYLDVDYNTSMMRSLGRVTCPKCGKSYNINFDKLKPKVDNICDDCGSLLSKRSDDNEETNLAIDHNMLIMSLMKKVARKHGFRCLLNDNEETFKKRFDTYIEVTKPIVNYYKDINKLIIVDARKDVTSVKEDVERVIRD